MNQSHTVNISEGQTLLLYKDNKILLRKKHDCNASVTTSWNSFVGSDDEVNAKVLELELSQIQKPLKKKEEQKSGLVKKSDKVPFSTKLLNFFKTIFSK